MQQRYLGFLCILVVRLIIMIMCVIILMRVISCCVLNSAYYVYTILLIICAIFGSYKLYAQYSAQYMRKIIICVSIYMQYSARYLYYNICDTYTQH